MVAGGGHESVPTYWEGRGSSRHLSPFFFVGISRFSSDRVLSGTLPFRRQS